MRNARVTISRPQSSRGGSSIAISIDDDDSRLAVLRIEMTLADFAACVTGHGHMPAKVESWIGKNAERIGKTLEVRELLLTGRHPYGDRETREWVRSHPELILADGWEIHSDGVGSQQTVPGKHRILLGRYVEAKP